MLNHVRADFVGLRHATHVCFSNVPYRTLQPFHTGWTALHWSAFLGNVETAKVLASDTGLMWVKDTEGNTPIDMARKEGNDKVAEIYEAALGEGKKSK